LAHPKAIESSLAIPMTSAFLPASENTNVPSTAAARNAVTEFDVCNYNLIGGALRYVN
jgi:hypothetical protein